MSRATLPAEARLHRPSEFAAALKGRRLARGAMFIVSAAPASQASAPDNGVPVTCARLGLVIAKRYAALAVTRNALKRVIRESFRHQRLALPPQDYVVRLHSKVGPATLTQLKLAARTEVDAHFGRIRR